MKTAEDFKKLIEGFSGDISADNALQVSAIRNGLELHCNSSSTSYVLQLAGGTTDDYASHIQTCFNVIVSSFAEYHKLDPIQTKSTIIHHLKNTLTDRVAVNHCVVQSL